MGKAADGCGIAVVNGGPEFFPPSPVSQGEITGGANESRALPLAARQRDEVNAQPDLRGAGAVRAHHAGVRLHHPEQPPRPCERLAEPGGVLRGARRNAAAADGDILRQVLPGEDLPAVPGLGPSQAQAVRHRTRLRISFGSALQR